MSERVIAGESFGASRRDEIAVGGDECKSWLTGSNECVVTYHRRRELGCIVAP
jgi:hypothetical protein